MPSGLQDRATEARSPWILTGGFSRDGVDEGPSTVAGRPGLFFSHLLDEGVAFYVGRSLQDILDNDGYLELRALETRVLRGIDTRGAVVATGGSAIYSDDAMAHLGSGSHIVYLEVPLAEVIQRIGDYSARGVAKPPDQSLEDTFLERQRGYERWADVTIDATQPVETVVDQVCAWFQAHVRAG